MAEGNPNNSNMNNNLNNNNIPNQVIHIRGDSDSELQALFDTVLKPNSASARQQAGSVPLRLRKLPSSFFNPPSASQQQQHQARIISHSRDGSVDSGAPNTRPLPGPQSVHFRAHSSPATLEQTLSLGQPLGSPSVSASNLSDDPLPPGWEQATTAEGRIYFINHFTRSTTWDDPRKAQHAQILEAVGQQLSSGGCISPGLQPGGPLPQGWEQAMTPEGQVYFINHEKQTTSWFDPRLPAHMQRPPVLQQQLTNAANAALAAGLTNNNARQQDQARLQQLQLERERLKMRQVEILRQMEAEKQRLSKRPPEDDPFLGDHTRQESADSGLGIAYSIPHTPENFLQEPFPSSGDENMELSSGLPAEDELVPSIDLSTELLNEIHEIVAKDNMTWL